MRDGLFLTVFRATELPKVMLAGALLCLAVAVLSSRAVSRYGLRNALSVFSAAAGAAFAVECVLLRVFPRSVAVALYLHVVLLAALSVVVLWGIMSPRGTVVLGGPGGGAAGHRTTGIATAAVALGASLGALLTQGITAWLGLRATLLILAAFCAGVAAAAQRLPDVIRPEKPERTGISELRHSRYIQTVGGLAALAGLTSLVADYVLKLEASRAFRSMEALVAFFSAFYAATLLFGFLVDAWLARPVLRRFGLGAALTALPASVLLAGVFALGLTRLWTSALLKGSEAVLSVSLFRSGRELLGTPFATDAARSAVPFVRAGMERVGEIAAAALLLGMVTLAPSVPTTVFVGLVVLSAAGGLWSSYRASQEYATELATSLRTSALRIEPEQVVDATTRAVAAEVANAVDKEQMLAELKRLRRSRVGVIQPPASPTHPPDSRLAVDSALMDTLGELTAGEPSRVLAALESGPLDPRALPEVIALLANDRVAGAAGAALRVCAGTAVGQLSDALLDPQQPYAVRRRVPRLLTGVRNSRVVAALLEALKDEELEVRQRSGRALYQIVVERPDLRPEPWVVHEAAMREIETLPAPEVETMADPALRRRVRAQLRHVLTLAGLGAEPEGIELAARALDSGNDTLRATAVEYLDCVLPAHLRPKLMAHLGKASGDGQRTRSRRELLEELSRAVAASADMDESLPPPPAE